MVNRAPAGIFDEARLWTDEFGMQVAVNAGFGSLWHWLIIVVIIGLLFLPGGPGDILRRK